MKKGRRGKGRKSPSRRIALKALVALAVLLAAWGFAAEWFVHHSPRWLETCRASWPAVATVPLLWLGNPLADLTDGLGWTGHDAVYEYDCPAPSGAVAFAGLPRRTGDPAPDDIRVVQRGEFAIGWSDSLRHPVWCAYHVPKAAPFEAGKRPPFVKDRAIPAAPDPGDYKGCGYDRGHMVPNYAMATRFGEAAQRLTFMMGNVAPQSPALNRGVWRDVEHRIADLWTARYGEIWVVVGCIPSRAEKIGGTGIDVPSRYFQVVVAQEDMDVRALAVVFDQSVPWSEWAARHIVTIDELEEITGLDFNPDLAEFIQSPLEAELPSRLWPVRGADIFRQIALRFGY